MFGFKNQYGYVYINNSVIIRKQTTHNTLNIRKYFKMGTTGDYNVEKTRDYLSRWLDQGDKTLAANEFNMSVNSVYRILRGETKNLKVLGWLLEKAKKNEQALKDFQ